MGHLLHLWQQDLQAIKMQSATANNEKTFQMLLV